MSVKNTFVAADYSIKVKRDVYIALTSRQTRELSRTGMKPSMDEVLRLILGLGGAARKRK